MGNKQSKWKEIGISNIDIYHGVDEMSSVNANQILMEHKLDSEIYVYNIHSKQLTFLSPYCNGVGRRRLLCPLSYDSYSNKVYFVTAIRTEYPDSYRAPDYYPHALIICDAENKKFRRQNIVLSQYVNEYSHLQMVHIHEKLHILVLGRGHHIVYDKNTQQTVYIDTSISTTGTKLSFSGVTYCVYVPTQNVILAICINEIFSFDLKTSQWKRVTDHDGNELRCIGGPPNRKAILAMDEKSIIFIPDRKYPSIRYLKIMDIVGENRYKLRKSKISVPTGQSYDCRRYFVVAGGDKARDESLVFAFVRKSCTEYQTRMISNDVVNVIISYHIGEYLHCIRIWTDPKKKNSHCMMPLSMIVR